MKPLLRYGSLLGLILLLLGGCGRKEAPLPERIKSMPEISQLNIDTTEEVVRIRLRLDGGRAGIGYQIDRAELDPYCKCPDMWSRYFEAQPTPQNKKKEIVKIIRLEAGKKRYLYRLRAVDGEGHLSRWSKVIHTEKAPSDG